MPFVRRHYHLFSHMTTSSSSNKVTAVASFNSQIKVSLGLYVDYIYLVMLFSTKKIHIQSFISLLGHPLDHLVNFSKKSEHAVFDDRRRDRRERDNVIIKHHIRLAIMVILASLIIRLFQLVLSVGTVFFSHSKSAGTVFRLVFSAKRTRPIYL